MKLCAAIQRNDHMNDHINNSYFSKYFNSHRYSTVHITCTFFDLLIYFLSNYGS